MKRATLTISVPVSVDVIFTGHLDDDGVFHAEDWDTSAEPLDVERRDLESELFTRLDEGTVTIVPDEFDEAQNPTVECRVVVYDGTTYTHDGDEP